MPALGPNAHLIGEPGSRARLCTPALLLELEAFEHNLATMAAFCRRAGRGAAAARQDPQVGRDRAQAARGGRGRDLLRHDRRGRAPDRRRHRPLLITSPITTDPKLRRLAALLERAEGLLVVADRVAAVERLAGIAAGAAAAARRAGRPRGQPAADRLHQQRGGARRRAPDRGLEQPRFRRRPGLRRPSPAHPGARRAAAPGRARG